MKSFRIFAVLFVVSVQFLISGCAQDNKSLILGVWEGNQATQKVGSDEEHFNYLEITDTTIHAKHFNMVAIESGIPQKKFNDETKDMKYEWKSENEILIEDSLFEVELKKNEMILSNENIEINYSRQR
ncbi:hypothetical protein ACK8P5_08890 [Paenibacillus sp. EC2-1]|uniref:hypothetical protein n=1 Tax=Paenibacillus sp. EC2-1 TaxID=3388665 RepID=UPI003BEF3A8A